MKKNKYIYACVEYINFFLGILYATNAVYITSMKMKGLNENNNTKIKYNVLGAINWSKVVYSINIKIKIDRICWYLIPTKKINFTNVEENPKYIV